MQPHCLVGQGEIERLKASKERCTGERYPLPTGRPLPALYTALTCVIVEESVLGSKHVRRPHDSGIWEDLFHNLFPKGLLEGRECGGKGRTGGGGDRGNEGEGVYSEY